MRTAHTRDLPRDLALIIIVTAFIISLIVFDQMAHSPDDFGYSLEPLPPISGESVEDEAPLKLVDVDLQNVNELPASPSSNSREAKAARNAIVSGEKLHTAGKLDAAIQKYQTALKLDPRSVRGHRNLGNAYAETGDMRQAAVHLDLASKLDASDPLVWVELGHVYLELGIPDLALYALNKALTISPNDLEAHYNMAIYLTRYGDVTEAIQHYEAVLEIEPENIRALNNLSNVYKNQNQPAQAIVLLYKAVQITPDNPVIIFNLAQAYELGGERERAIEYYERAATLFPPGELREHSQELAQGLAKEMRSAVNRKL